MKRFIQILAVPMLIISLVLVDSCTKDTPPVELKLSTLKAGTIDLNGASSATGVPVGTTIVATFTADIDATTATDANITVTRTYDAADLPKAIAVSGASITITPTDPLGNGTTYELKFTTGLKSKDAKPLTYETKRSFTTEGTFAVAGAIAYWNFEDNANDQAGTFNPATDGIVDITYTASRNAAAGKAATFNGTTSIIEIPNGDQLSNTHDFTLSFWVKAVSDGHVDAGGNPKGHFVIGLGAFKGFQFEIPGDYSSCKLAASYEMADGTTSSEDLWFPGNGQTKDNGGWKGWTYCQDLTGTGGVAALIMDKWANVAIVYEAATKLGTMYINGVKMKQQDFNLYDAPKTGTVGLKYGGVSPEVENKLAFGFIHSRVGTLFATEPWGNYTLPTSNHFQGQLDDVRIYHKVLTPGEITSTYNSEK
jgi:hypothetical protein